MESAYDFEARSLAGQPVSLADFRGRVTLVVNTASKCGYTPQYDGLQALHRRFEARGFAVLGFPCNQFGAQEPGTSNEIATFCDSRFSVTFPMFEKVDVNGERAHPLWKFLKGERPGLLGTEGIKWNFTKFLVDREGRVVRRFAPATKPEDIAADVEALL